MRLLVVGATGALGQEIVAEAVARGHDTGALVRNPARARFPEAVEIVQGDVLEPSSLTIAAGGRDAVICALGTPSPRRASTLLERGTKNLVAAMSQEGVPRLVCVTLLGAGSSRANASLFYRRRGNRGPYGAAVRSSRGGATRILVVGSTGLIGAPVARRLLSEGHHKRLLVRDVSRARVHLGAEFEYLEGPVADSTSVDRAVEGMTACT